MNKIVKLSGIILITFGLFLLFEKFNIIHFSIKYMFYAGMICIGFFWFFTSSNSGKRYQTFFSVILFLFGILFFSTELIQINVTSRILFFSSFFASGIAFLMIFFENIKYYWFLFVAVLLILIGLLPFFGLIKIPVIYNINISDILTYWPFLIILAGILYILNIKKH